MSVLHLHRTPAAPTDLVPRSLPHSRSPPNPGTPDSSPAQLLSVLFLWYLQIAFPTPTADDLRARAHDSMSSLEAKAADKLVKTADATVSAPAGDKTELDPPKDTPFSKAELAKNDGRDENTPIYVGIKGRIYDGAPRSPAPS